MKNRNQLTQPNQLPGTAFFREQNSAFLALPTAKNNSTLSCIASEAIRKREIAISRLAGLIPARPSIAFPMHQHLIATSNRSINKRCFENMIFPTTTSQSTYSAIPKRQRMEDRLSSSEQKGLAKLQSSTSPLLCASSVSAAKLPPKAKRIAMTCDKDNLTPYQCVARQQIELFAAGAKEVEAGTKGRNRTIVAGQVGLRCRHCAHLPLRARAKGSTIYPSKLSGIYQASQNMANSHVAQYCQEVPPEIRDSLKTLGNRKSSAGGGRDYWASGAKILGVCEDSHGLRFDNGACPL